MTRTITTLAVALATTLTLATTVSAQPKAYVQPVGVQPSLVQPAPMPVVLPKFGFQSYNLSGIGERVTYVQCHGLAAQMGLEPGDVILSMNGMPLTYHGAWNQALTNAMYQGGSVQLAIRDVNTGYVVYRNTFVGGGPVVGPITPKSQPIGTPGPITIYNQQPQGNYYGQPGPITQKSVAGKNNNLSGSPKLKVNSQTIKQFGNLLSIGE